MPDLTYTTATESDIAGIQAAARESWRATYGDIFAPDFIEDFVSRNYAPAALHIAIARSADIFLIAKDGDRIVGFCHLGDRGGGPELYRLYLVPAYWRRGAGTRLLAELERRLRVRGIPAYRCYVHERNEPAQAFYARLGFTRDPSCDDGDDQCLRRSLAQPPTS